MPIASEPTCISAAPRIESPKNLATAAKFARRVSTRTRSPYSSRVSDRARCRRRRAAAGDDRGQPIGKFEIPNPLPHHLPRWRRTRGGSRALTVHRDVAGAGGAEDGGGAPERLLVTDDRDDVSLRQQGVRSRDVDMSLLSNAADHERRIRVQVHDLADGASHHAGVPDDELADARFRYVVRRFERDTPQASCKLEAEQRAHDAHGIGHAVTQHRQVGERLHILWRETRIHRALTHPFLHGRQRGRVSERAAVQPRQHGRRHAKQPAERERNQRAQDQSPGCKGIGAIALPPEGVEEGSPGAHAYRVHEEDEAEGRDDLGHGDERAREPTANPTNSTPAMPNRNPNKLTCPSRNPSPITTNSVRIGDPLNALTSGESMCIGAPGGAAQTSYSNLRALARTSRSAALRTSHFAAIRGSPVSVRVDVRPAWWQHTSQGCVPARTVRISAHRRRRASNDSRETRRNAALVARYGPCSGTVTACLPCRKARWKSRGRSGFRSRTPWW